MNAAGAIFWIAAGLILYSYVLYPALLQFVCLLTKTRRPPGADANRSPEDWPFVSLIIAAYKEEDVILARVHNALQMDYPADRLEILIGCDGAEDATGELVKTVQDSRIRLLQFPQRRGKPSVLNDAVSAAKGDLLAFSDANTFWERDALKKLVLRFDDERIGGACGQLLLTDPKTGENVDGLYWRYENFLKQREGKLGALLGFNGAIYVIRRDMWSPIPPQTIVDDFLIGMKIHLAGKKLIFEETAVANEESAPNLDAEFHRRARIGAGGFQSLSWLLPLLSPRYGFVAVAFWSHKVLRWFCPLLMAIALVSNLWLLHLPWGKALLAAQLAFYAVAFLGRTLPGNSLGIRLVRLASMFVGMNAALAVGGWRWLRNGQSGAWKRTVRSQELQRTQSAERQQVGAP